MLLQLAVSRPARLHFRRGLNLLSSDVSAFMLPPAPGRISRITAPASKLSDFLSGSAGQRNAET
jgi:hypothetical protein